MYCLATASSPDKVDSSLLREGRLSVEIFIENPTESVRKEILENLLQNKVKVDIDNLVKLTAGFVASDLKMLISLVSVEYSQRVK